MILGLCAGCVCGSVGGVGCVGVVLVSALRLE